MGSDGCLLICWFRSVTAGLHSPNESLCLALNKQTKLLSNMNVGHIFLVKKTFLSEGSPKFRIHFRDLRIHKCILKLKEIYIAEIHIFLTVCCVLRVYCRQWR